MANPKTSSKAAIGRNAFRASTSTLALAAALGMGGVAQAQTVQPAGGGAVPAGCSPNGSVVLCTGTFNAAIAYEAVGPGSGNSELSIAAGGAATINSSTAFGVFLQTTANNAGITTLNNQAAGTITVTGANGAGMRMEHNGTISTNLFNFGTVNVSGNGTDGLEMLVGAGSTGQWQARLSNAGTVTSAAGNGMYLEIANGNVSNFASLLNTGTVTGGTSGSGMRGRIGSTVSARRIDMVNGASGIINQRAGSGSRGGMEAEQLGLGAISLTNQGTIDAQTGANTGRGMTAAVQAINSSANVTLLNSATGIIRSDRGGMSARGQTNGNVTLTNNGTINDDDFGAGMDVNVAGAGRSGNSTIVNAGTISASGNTGILASDESTGNLSITNSGSVTSTGSDAIYIDGGNRTGATVVDNSGSLSAATTGISYDGQSASGTVSITSSGTIQTTNNNGYGIFAGSDTTSLLKVEVNNSTGASDEISTSGNAAHAIFVDATNGANNVDVDLAQDASIKTNGSGAHGMILRTQDTATNTAGLDVDVAGTLDTTAAAFGNALQVNITGSQVGTTNNYGSVEIAGTALLQAGSGDGIHVFASSASGPTSAQLDVNIAAGAQVTSASGYGFHNVDAANNVNMINIVDVAGTLSGGAGAADLGSGDDTFIFRETATVTGQIDGGADADTLQFDFASAKSQDASQFTNFENLTKTSAGQLTFTGTNTDAMAVLISGGTIAFNGTMANSTVTASAGTTIMGSGTVGGITANGGTVAPGNSIGTLTVNGNVAFGDNSTYAVEVDTAGNSDRIEATGTATISSNGTTLAVSGPNVIYPTGTQTYRVLNAAGGVSGQFASVTDSIPDVDFSAVYGANSVDVQYVKTATSGTPSVTPTGTPASTNLSDKSIYAANNVAGLEASSVFTASLGAYARNHFIEPLPAQGDGVFGDAKPIAFVTGVGQTSRIDQATTAPSYGHTLGGVIAGVGGIMDLESGIFFGGIAGGFTKGSISNGIASADTQFAHFGTFGSLRTGQWTVSGSASYNFGTFDTKRTLTVGTAQIVALNELRASNFAGELEAAYDIAPMLGVQNTSIQPYGRLEASFGSVRGGTETGAGVLNLTVASSNPSQIYAETGMRFATDIVQDNMVLRPSLGFGYRHLLAESGIAGSSNLQITGQTFGSAVASRARSQAVVSAGLEFQLEDLTASVQYNGSFAKNTRSHDLSASIGFTF